MHLSTLLVALVTAVIIWIFLVRRLTAKPWVMANEIDDIGPVQRPPAKVALWILLCCITSLFSLFMTAYLMRMDPNIATDWYSISTPGVLWLNTGLLVLSSLGMQWARKAEQTDNMAGVRAGLAAGGLFTLAFLGGQLLAWQQLKNTAYFDMANPAVGFFYLLTAVHGLHLLGGLYVWTRTTLRVWNRSRIEKGSLSIELCTTYWHYLLLVWFILFSLFLST